MLWRPATRLAQLSKNLVYNNKNQHRVPGTSFSQKKRTKTLNSKHNLKTHLIVSPRAYSNRIDYFRLG